jgi:hypothetical protein
MVQINIELNIISNQKVTKRHTGLPNWKIKCKKSPFVDKIITYAEKSQDISLKATNINK